jgi:hypothetical protein
MGCGCKNKQNEAQAALAQPAPGQIQTPQQPQNSQTVQEQVNKVVEKYYKK